MNAAWVAHSLSTLAIGNAAESNGSNKSNTGMNVAFARLIYAAKPKANPMRTRLKDGFKVRIMKRDRPQKFYLLTC